MLGLLALFMWETSAVGIPESISKQVAFVQALGGEWLLRYVELPLLGFISLLIAIGPNRLQAWIKWLREMGRRPEADKVPTDPHKEKAAYWEQRRQLYKLLNDLHEEGSRLREADYGLKPAHYWEVRADQLIEAALGKERARDFRAEDPGYALYGEDLRKGDSEGQIRMALLLHRLKALALEISSLTAPIELQADFEPQRYE